MMIRYENRGSKKTLSSWDCDYQKVIGSLGMVISPFRGDVGWPPWMTYHCPTWPARGWSRKNILVLTQETFDSIWLYVQKMEWYITSDHKKRNHVSSGQKKHVLLSCPSSFRLMIFTCLSIFGIGRFSAEAVAPDDRKIVPIPRIG